MKSVIQRVKNASVKVNDEITGSIDHGLLVLLGVHRKDDAKLMEWAAQKIVGLRIFSDERGRFQYDLAHVSGQILVVSQFTLFGDCLKGRRPEFLEAAEPSKAEELYEYFLKALKNLGFEAKKGVFGAKMEVFSVNDGPVTLILER